MRNCLKRMLMAVLAISMLSSGVALADEPVLLTPEQIADEQLACMEAEIVVLAKILYAEARGVKSTMERAAVVWCVLNRVDTDCNNTIIGVATARHQFAYKARLKARYYEPQMALARDVVRRWLLEKQGVAEVGRVLPPNYLWFAGRRGHNYFRDAFKIRKANVYAWDLPNPYES